MAKDFKTGLTVVVPEPGSKMKGKRYPRAVCRECGRDMPVLTKGKIARHVKDGKICPGAYKLPEGVSF